MNIVSKLSFTVSAFAIIAGLLIILGYITPSTGPMTTGWLYILLGLMLAVIGLQEKTIESYHNLVKEYANAVDDLIRLLKEYSKSR